MAETQVGIELAAPKAPPSNGPGHYLRDLVYGASDGVVTTLAVIAGAAGAGFASRVGVVLGLANLFADGLSMAVSNYLGMKSELEQTERSIEVEQPWRHGLATLVAFIVVGAVPLLTFVFAVPGLSRFQVALVLALTALAGAGAARSLFIQRPAWRCALEMLLLAGAASAIAYLIGELVAPLVS
jgi:VIT1/CCC1 family predicted Fe2+/Mn2+ transporter